MLDRLTKEAFSGLVGETFAIYLAPSAIVETTLVEVNALGAPAGGPEQVRKEPFSIILRGPQQPPLAQGMYHVEQDQLGSLEGLFLVPVAADQQGRYYEAVFT